MVKGMSMDDFFTLLSKGRFTFKNGRYYEGQFDSDHIKEYPNFGMDGTSTPDITGLRTCTPLPMGKHSIF